MMFVYYLNITCGINGDEKCKLPFSLILMNVTDGRLVRQ